MIEFKFVCEKCGEEAIVSKSVFFRRKKIGKMLCSKCFKAENAATPEAIARKLAGIEKQKATAKKNNDPSGWRKRKQQMIEKFGSVKAAYQHRVEASKETCMKKYGVPFSWQSENNKSKAKKTCLEKYGADSFTKTEAGKAKISKWYRDQRNSDNAEEHYRKVCDSRDLEVVSIDKTQDEHIFHLRCKKCGAEFTWQKKSNVYRPYCHHCLCSGRSKLEEEVFAFVQSLDHNAKANVKHMFERDSRYEVDVLSNNIAIEFDGTYWHDNVNNYWKYEELKRKNIRLIQILEPDWLLRKDICKSIISTALNVKPQHILYARNCKVREIDAMTAEIFCDSYHLRGYARSKVKLGLFYNDELVQVMTFAKPRFKSTCEWELVRECSKLDTSIVGGKQKLLKYFEKHWKPKSLLSYCDKSMFSGESYLRCGFSYVKDTKPGYFYINKNCIDLEPREKYQKYKLKSLLKDFDPSKTELENMQENGYRILWNYGNKVFEKRYSN